MMVLFKSLRITNLKRFSGEHVLPLYSEDGGNVTIIAAQNGVGKTTVIDAMNLALHGKRAIMKRYPGIVFKDWLNNAFSAASAAEDGYKHILVGIELSTENAEAVHITRSYWFDENDFDEEFGLTIDGSPIRLESGESRKGVAEAWVEAILPLSLTQRFLVDGERLSDLDIRNLETQLKLGVDDLLGQGTIGRLNRHLHSIQKDTMKQMTPEDERDTLDSVMDIAEGCQSDIEELQMKIDDCNSNKVSSEARMQELQTLLTEKSRNDGTSVGELRIAQAVSASELAQSRKDVRSLLESSLPFILAGIPEDLDEWNYSKAKEMGNKGAMLQAASELIDKAVNYMNPAIKKADVSRLKEAIEQVSDLDENADIPKRFRVLSLQELESLEELHNLFHLSERDSELSVLDSALAKLEQSQEATQKLQEYHAKMGLESAADELANLGLIAGGLGAELINLESEREKKGSELKAAEEKIEALRSAGNKDSKLEKRIELILQLRQILDGFAKARRTQMSEPLEEAFSAGFSLLSRKAKDVESVEINSETYDVHIGLKGFEGNWLDRDLSATEKQHVGLSLLYALRKLAQRPLPVVVDTPTSRMDSEHKGWSVTRFYPELSHQVIVLATSDDLSDGLYESLQEEGVIGSEVRLEEVGTTMLNVVEAPLASYF